MSWQREHGAELTFALVSRGTVQVNQVDRTAFNHFTRVLLQRDREVAHAYRARATPTAVVIRPDGTVGSPLAPGTAAIAALVHGTVGASARESPTEHTERTPTVPDGDDVIAPRGGTTAVTPASASSAE